MKRIPSIPLFLLGLALSVAADFGAGPDDVIGIWNNQEQDARIEIVRCGDLYCGTIVWLKDPNYPEGAREGKPGTQKLDHHNPDAGKRAMPLLGLQILNKMHFDKKGTWTGGTVYDPKSGNTYKGNMTLVSRDRLDLRGYIGIALFGRTTTWTRERSSLDAAEK